MVANSERSPEAGRNFQMETETKDRKISREITNGITNTCFLTYIRMNICALYFRFEV